MEACMICLQPQTKWSKEHVVGDALGGNLVIHEGVCRVCNTRMSCDFEEKFYKSHLCTKFKALKNIKGRRDITPKLFPGRTVVTETGRSATIDNLGRIKHTHDEIRIHADSKGAINISGDIDPDRIEEAKEIILKKIYRLNLPLLYTEDALKAKIDLLFKGRKINKKEAEIAYTIMYSPKSTLLTLCKSAYEILVYNYGLEPILRIENMNKIRKALLNNNHTEVPTGTMLTEQPDFWNEIDIDKSAHIIITTDKLWLANIANFWALGFFRENRGSTDFIKSKAYVFPYDGRGYYCTDLN